MYHQKGELYKLVEKNFNKVSIEYFEIQNVKKNADKRYLFVIYRISFKESFNALSWLLGIECDKRLKRCLLRSLMKGESFVDFLEVYRSI